MLSHDFLQRGNGLPLDRDQAAKAQGDDGGVAPKKIGGRLHNLEPHRDMLRAIVEETPDMTLERIANEVVARGGLRVGKSSVDRMLKHMGFRIKKKPDRRRADPH